MKQVLIIFLGLFLLNCNSLIGQNDSIIETQTKEDSIIKEELKKKKQIQMDLLNKEKALMDLVLKEKNAVQEIQNIVILVGFSVLIFLIVAFVVLIIRNRRLKKLLKEAQEKIDY